MNKQIIIGPIFIDGQIYLKVNREYFFKSMSVISTSPIEVTDASGSELAFFVGLKVVKTGG